MLVHGAPSNCVQVVISEPDSAGVTGTGTATLVRSAFFAGAFLTETFELTAFLAAVFFAAGAFFATAFLTANFASPTAAAPPIKNLDRSLASAIHEGARPRPLHVAPVFGCCYFGATGSFPLTMVLVLTTLPLTFSPFAARFALPLASIPIFHDICHQHGLPDTLLDAPGESAA